MPNFTDACCEDEAAVCANKVGRTPKNRVVVTHKQMGYYVVSGGKGAVLLSTWASAQKQVLGKTGVTCRAFPKKEDALRFMSGLRFEKGEVDDGALFAHVHASSDAFSVFFGEAGTIDSRSGAWRLLDSTVVRAQLTAVCLAVELAGAQVTVFSSSEFICRAYREHFPSGWANQDLMCRLAMALEVYASMIHRTQDSSAEAAAARNLCTSLK
jgi:hypothetical protein